MATYFLVYSAEALRWTAMLLAMMDYIPNTRWIYCPTNDLLALEQVFSVPHYIQMFNIVRFGLVY